MKKIIILTSILITLTCFIVGCGKQQEQEEITTYSERTSYVKGYEGAEADIRKGFSRTKRDISIMSLPLEVLQLDIV